MIFFRISRPIPENSDVCRFFNQICEHESEICRKFWILWQKFTIISELFTSLLSVCSLPTTITDPAGAPGHLVHGLVPFASLLTQGEGKAGRRDPAKDTIE